MTKFAVFDIDGTLVRWQLYHVIVSKLANEGVLGPDAKQKLRDTRMNWKRRQQDNSYKIYEQTLIEVYENSLATMTEAAFDKHVMDVINEYKDQTYTYTRKLLEKLKKDGYFLLIISGSHNELVEQIGRYYGFNDWIGTTYQRKDGGFTGQKHIVSLDKAAALDAFATKHKLDYTGSIAIGDTASDISMLEKVENPIAFNPDERLFKTAQERQWPIVVERKNVIYELKGSGSGYVLA